jgi:chromatin remodeling complex protein RSC6
LKRDLAIQKKQLADTHTEIKAVNTLLVRYSKKCIKRMEQTVTNSKRNPRGFACPSKVSDELCDFMGKPRGTKISRTETSSFLSKYIATNGLQDPERKSVILPDSKLIQLFGEDAMKSGDDLNYFNMQKHITPHFLK